MRRTIQLTTIALALLTLGLPLGAQTREGLVGDLLRDIGQVENKVMGLAKALPESAWAWRPGEGVRSTHVAVSYSYKPGARTSARGHAVASAHPYAIFVSTPGFMQPAAS